MEIFIFFGFSLPDLGTILEGKKNPLGLSYHTSNTFTSKILAKMLIVVVVLLLFPEASETCQMSGSVPILQVKGWSQCQKVHPKMCL